jgi:ABC-2 type transport system ATP-binding protein
MISLENVSAYYDDKEVVGNVTLQFHPGCITGIIGPNGAGKSTLIKAMTGLHGNYRGKIKFDGHDIEKDRGWIKQHCGYAPEDAELMPYLTGREHLELLASIYRLDDVNTTVDFFLELSGLKTVQSKLVLGYSHGMRKKLSLISALISRPEYIIMDEALNGLDPVALYRIKEYLIELLSENRTVILTSHIIALILEWCDPIVIMHKGEVSGIFSKEQIRELERENRISFEKYFVNLVAENA